MVIKMEITRENKYTIILSEYELRMLYTAMSNYSENKSDIERRVTENIFCALH